MKYDIEKIKEIVRSKPDTKIIYFWGHTPKPKKMTAACFMLTNGKVKTCWAAP
jgi:hypothetical protein